MTIKKKFRINKPNKYKSTEKLTSQFVFYNFNIFMGCNSRDWNNANNKETELITKIKSVIKIESFHETLEYSLKYLLNYYEFNARMRILLINGLDKLYNVGFLKRLIEKVNFIKHFFLLKWQPGLISGGRMIYRHWYQAIEKRKLERYYLMAAKIRKKVEKKLRINEKEFILKDNCKVYRYVGRIPDMIIALGTSGTNSLLKRETMNKKIPIIGVTQLDSDPSQLSYKIVGNDNHIESMKAYCIIFKNILNIVKVGIQIFFRKNLFIRDIVNDIYLEKKKKEKNIYISLKLISLKKKKKATKTIIKKNKYENSLRKKKKKLDAEIFRIINGKNINISNYLTINFVSHYFKLYK